MDEMLAVQILQIPQPMHPKKTKKELIPKFDTDDFCESS